MIPKFRAWSKVNIESPEMREVRGINWHGHNVWFNDFLDDETPADWADFDDIILMQSTGLFDKNGKEIFEGDVVIITDYDEFPRTVVRYVQGTYCLFEGDNCLEALADYYEDMEIIGNIHEHPNLVEVAHD